jgi:hypothetical protein
MRLVIRMVVVPVLSCAQVCCREVLMSVRKRSYAFFTLSSVFILRPASLATFAATQAPQAQSQMATHDEAGRFAPRHKMRF